MTTLMPDLIRIEDVTRRELMSSALAGALLVACGANEWTASPGRSTQTIDDHFGPVKLPTGPKRVIAADPTSLPIMLALGMKPVAAYFNPLVTSSYMGQEAEQVPNITSQPDEIDLEKALTFKPDFLFVLVGNNGNVQFQERYNRYRQAAPTYGWMRNNTSFEEVKGNVLTIARPLEMEEQARKVIGDLDARVHALRSRMSSFGDKRSLGTNVVRIWPDRIHLRANVTLKALGLEAVPVSTGTAPSLDLSLEQLRVLNDASTLLVMVNTNGVENYRTIQANPIWQGLEPVKNGRVHEVDSGYWLGDDPLAIHQVLNDVERLIIAPAEGR